MPMLGQASGGWTESSSALRILNLGIANSVGVLTDDSFTQTNPPITATGVTAQVDQTLSGVLSGSVCFSRGDVAGGSNFIGGPAAPGTANVRPLGLFINSANGNAFENTPGVASGKNPYVSAMGTYGNRLFEDSSLADAVALTAYATGQRLWASQNGYLTNALAADDANSNTQLYEQGNIHAATVQNLQPTLMGVVKMPPDATQGDLVFDLRV